jgi:hypothetical protein
VRAALMPDGSASAPAWLWGGASFPCRQLHPALAKPAICRLRPNLMALRSVDDEFAVPINGPTMLLTSVGRRTEGGRPTGGWQLELWSPRCGAAADQSAPIVTLEM